MPAVPEPSPKYLPVVEAGMDGIVLHHAELVDLLPLGDEPLVGHVCFLLVFGGRGGEDLHVGGGRRGRMKRWHDGLRGHRGEACLAVVARGYPAQQHE